MDLYSYDSASDLNQPGPIGGPYVFDAENHLISAGGMAYLYDGDGKRVGKAPASTPTQPNYLYWYGTGSQILEETNGAGNYLYEDFYFNGMLLARSESDNWVDHFFADALGNTRCVYGDSDPDGGCSDYYPFGGERPITNGGVNVPFKFTGKERDSESGLDNFGARYTSSDFGRFLSPDPDNAGASDDDPQSWNAYAYVSDNPLNMTDPDGRGGCDGRDPGGCIEVTANGPDDEILFSYSYKRIMLRQLSNAAQRANDLLHAAWDWYRTSRLDTTCLLASTVAGATAGASAGIEYGPAAQLALAPLTGGGSEFLGGPLGGAALGGLAGGLGGGSAGFMVGQIACRTGTGSGGGGGGNEHFKKARTRAGWDPNRVIQEGRKFKDSESGYTVHVDGNRVVITDPNNGDEPVTMFENSAANTQQRIQSGKWIPQ